MPRTRRLQPRKGRGENLVCAAYFAAPMPFLSLTVADERKDMVLCETMITIARLFGHFNWLKVPEITATEASHSTTANQLLTLQEAGNRASLSPGTMFATTTRLVRGVGGARPFSLLGGVSLRSSGVIFDPYKYVPEEDKPSLLSAQGVKAKIDLAASVAKSSYSSAFIQRHFPDFSHRNFPDVAEAVFTKFMDGYRAGDVAALRSCVTEGLLDGVRRELRVQGAGAAAPAASGKAKRKGDGGPQAAASAAGGKLRSAFEVSRFVRRAEVVQMRHGFAAGMARDKESGFGQVTCLVFSERRVVHVDAGGNVAKKVSRSSGSSSGGEGDALVAVPSLLVLEVGFGDKGGNWRIARIEEIGSRANLPLPLR